MGFVGFIFELLLELGADMFVSAVTADGAESVRSGRRFAVGCLVLIALGLVVWFFIASRQT